MDVRKFFRSFRFAGRGIRHALGTEQNFRLHLAAAAAATAAGVLTGLSAIEWIILILLFAGMFSLELVNTAIERIVDKASPELHPLAGQAKDTAAGAVLVFAAASALIGALIFLPKWWNLFY
ncbi:diacylglycerol kinase family protein [Bhargavaea cecembensis]|uniref:diacylglycerol kinase family protein n=1 Tax=Bhargavaea cecembensis TaxID=394098 RepID=UPI00058D5821|nr:diacylglycerol kinase family protein [Bhargavaea cecembensis]